MKKGLALLFIVSTFLIAACFAPSIHAKESKAYSRYKLVSESVSGNYKTCTYENVRKQVKTKSVSKGRSCPSVY